MRATSTFAAVIVSLLSAFSSPAEAQAPGPVLQQVVVTGHRLRFNGNLTLQKAKYTEFQSNVGGVPTSNPAIIGNDLERQPHHHSLGHQRLGRVPRNAGGSGGVL